MTSNKYGDVIQNGVNKKDLHRYFVNFNITREKYIVGNLSAIVQWDAKRLTDLRDLCMEACKSSNPDGFDICDNVSIHCVTELPMVDG